MKAKTRILVPIDFSKESYYGLKSALDIARYIGGELQLLHVIDEPIGTPFSFAGDTMENKKAYQQNVHYTAELIRKKTEQLRGLRIEYHDPTVRITFAVKNGLYKKGLQEYLNNHEIDLVVIGTTGETSISEFFTGNHAEQAVKIADVPVLAVQGHYSPIRFDKMLLGISLKDYDKRLVNLITRFADLLKMRLLIVHVKQSEATMVHDILDDLQRFVNQHGITNYSLMVAEKGNVTEQLEKTANEKGADIIATITEGASGLIRILFGSKTEKIMERTGKPVLSISE